MFFLPALAAVIAAPQLLGLTNRVFEEYLIPRRSLKKGAAGTERIYPVGFDLAITESEMTKLQQTGALQILQQGADRHHHLARAGVAEVCSHCQRLQG
jgi:hypothetical protein